MTSISAAVSPNSFEALRTKMTSFPVPLFHPDKPHDPSLSDDIASLYVHPALEALLHLLNHDLAAAHFLVRHMQSPPAYEGMYVHGILHRIDGDLDNARAWYADVSGWEGFERFWGRSEGTAQGGGCEQKLPPQTGAKEFLNDLEEGVKHGCSQHERARLAERSRHEIESLLDWCVDRFGTMKRIDVTEEWVKPSEEISERMQDMTSGEAGYRKF